MRPAPSTHNLTRAVRGSPGTVLTLTHSRDLAIAHVMLLKG